jgi:hypothetical protein
MVDFGFDVVIKFGMNLHRDPDELPATHGVLSFHHGDPSEYRGRPAGFYEVLDGADHVGAIVQRIGNKLDAGEVLAYAASQVAPHSYHQTLERLYGNSQHLLVKALRNSRNGVALDHPVNGRNYSLPSNSTVVKFIGLMAIRRMKRAGYAALIEKRWRVGRTNAIDPARTKHVVYLREPDDLMLPKGFAFTADPCPGGGGADLVRGFGDLVGKGRLLVFSPDRPPLAVDVPGVRGHHSSYPFIVESQGTRYVLPETATVGPPRLFELDGASIVGSQGVRGLGAFRIIDPTDLFHAGRWWLFGGLPTTSTDLLWLWSATDVAGPYEPHPDNPIVMDARARSAGPIIAADPALVSPRPGQPGQLWQRRYINRDHRVVHGEVSRGTTGAGSSGGTERTAHAVLDGDSIVVDSYVERFSTLAGMTRLKNRVPFSRN